MPVFLFKEKITDNFSLIMINLKAYELPPCIPHIRNHSCQASSVIGNHSLENSRTQVLLPRLWVYGLYGELWSYGIQGYCDARIWGFGSYEGYRDMGIWLILGYGDMGIWGHSDMTHMEIWGYKDMTHIGIWGYRDMAHWGYGVKVSTTQHLN